MPKNKRVSKREYEQRLDVVSSLQSRGLSTMQVVRAICQQWDICERQALRYLKDAKKQDDSFAEQPFQEHFSYMLSKYRFIYQQAVLLEDLGLSLRALESLGNLIKKTRKELINDPSQSHPSRLVGSDELEALIQSLEKEGKNNPE